MRMVIVTGMSGAGKSTALKMLEDFGYFCVDNLPVTMIPGMVDVLTAEDSEVEKAALGVDIRSGRNFHKLEEVLNDLDDQQVSYEILFLDSEDPVLIKRYKETRRSHPLSGNSGSVDEGIRKERRALKFLKPRATYVLDTSHTLTRELRAELVKIFVDDKSFKNMFVTVMSFGFKYGIPADADLVFDVRFLPNPYYDLQLRPKTGNDKEIQDYVMNNETAHVFLNKLTELIAFLIPNYIDEGKSQLVVAVGCTGGKHRSVTVANALYEEVLKMDGIGVRREHRDIGKDAITKAL